MPESMSARAEATRTLFWRPFSRVLTNMSVAPCACAGSMRFVHEQCLLRWLRHSQGALTQGYACVDFSLKLPKPAGATCNV